MPAAAPSRVERPESSLLLLEVRLDALVLGEPLAVYDTGIGVLVPLGALCRQLEIGVEVDPATGTAWGFCISPKRTFSLDLARASAKAEGRAARFDPASAEVHDLDIYVDTRVLGHWFPFELEVDRRAAILRVRAKEPLPVQLRLQRQREIDRTLANLGRSRPAFPSVPVPYAFWGLPFVDASFTWTGHPDGHRIAQPAAQHSIFATGDFLYMEAGLHILGDRVHPLSDVRAQVGRKDPEPSLLGPFRAREFAVGDVFDPGLDLILLPYSGTGALVSNFPLQLPSQFDRHTFRGDLPAGWEVELHHNGALLAYQRAGADGRYEFTDVPLLFGANRFDLVFYGPQGERREETHVFNVDASMTPPGEIRYRLVGNDPQNASARSSADLEVGLSKRLSASMSLAEVEQPDGRHEYGKVGLRTSRGSLFGDAQVAADRDGGFVIESGVQAGWASTSVQFHHAELYGFESETLRPLWGAIRSRTSSRLAARVPAPFLRTLPLQVDYQHDLLESRASIHQFSGRISASGRGLFLSDWTQWRFSRGSQRTIEPRAAGALLLSTFARRFSLRQEFAYDLRPACQLTSLGANVESHLTPSYLVGAGVERSLASSRTHYTFSLKKSTGAFGLGLRSEWAPREGVSFSFGLSAGINYDPRSGSWHSQARPVAGSGAASAAVFLDQNANGILDPGEQALDTVGFAVNGATHGERTGSDGLAFLKNLPSDQASDIGMSTRTLEDPLWVPERPGVRVVARPGKVARVDFPVVVSGEIAGTVRLMRNGKMCGAGGLQVELVSTQDGTRLQRVMTAYDGYYDLTQIPPGHYVLRVEPEQLSHIAAKVPASRHIEIATMGSILDGVDFLLLPADRTSTAPASAH